MDAKQGVVQAFWEVTGFCFGTVSSHSLIVFN